MTQTYFFNRATHVPGSNINIILFYFKLWFGFVICGAWSYGFLALAACDTLCTSEIKVFYLSLPLYISK
jgi:hypothetical protein